ncbi:MAG TPA: hypothetical protein VLK65_07450 [Vicinamibacteria bacterium]|nr:hypothetical protein [Vicinamibacteria bacterium]
MTSHFLILSVFALAVSVGFALLMRETPREQIRFGIFAFLCFLGSAFLLGWLMYPFPS